MFPILFRIGSTTVYSYTVALALGIAAGTWVAYKAAQGRISAPAHVLDAGFWGLLGAMLGGRAAYVLANWAYFADHVDRAIDLRGGGLSWHGALIGSTAAAAAWIAVRGRVGLPVPGWRELFDAAAPGLAVGGAFGWLACLLTGAAYGAEAAGIAPPLSWLAADLPDIYGVDRIRFLTQPLMIAWCALLAGGLWALREKLPRGAAFGLYLLLYALADFVLAFMRGDGTWRLGLWLWQWFALCEVLVAAGILLRAFAFGQKGARP